MRKIFALVACALLLPSVGADSASAQGRRGGHGGGHGGVSSFRGGGPAMGGRSMMVARPGMVGRAGIVGRPAIGGSGYVARRGYAGRAGYIGRPVVRSGWVGPRRGWGWGVPVGVGIAAGYYGSCWRWNGWDWVNVCYAPPGYYGYDPFW